jgi:hypothetical protein
VQRRGGEQQSQCGDGLFFHLQNCIPPCVWVGEQKKTAGTISCPGGVSTDCGFWDSDFGFELRVSSFPPAPGFHKGVGPDY